jgi:hypothetical protein
MLRIFQNAKAKFVEIPKSPAEYVDIGKMELEFYVKTHF